MEAENRVAKPVDLMPPRCPECGSRGVRDGKVWRRRQRYQRYLCTACGRTYVGEPLGRPLTIRDFLGGGEWGS